ncbi:MAG: magnesium transporter [bacterium]
MVPKMTLLFYTVRKLINRGATSNLSNMINKLHPADIAQVMQQLGPSDRFFLFGLISDKEKTAEVLSELNPPSRSELLEQLDTKKIADIFKEMSPDDLADIIGDMPKEVANKVLESLGKKDSEQIQELLKYEEDTAGGIMSTHFLALNENITVKDALERIRAASDDIEVSFYLYLIDDFQHLTGILSFRKLLTSALDTPLKKLMKTDVISVRVDEDQEDVAKIVERYNILSVPVVDRYNKLVGVVTVDDVIDVIRAETTEDIYKMAGTSHEELFEKSTWKVVMMRMPWLLITLIGETCSYLIMRWHQSTLTEHIASAFFIPMILALGGNVGNQSQTIVVRGLATGRIMDTEQWRILFKQIRIGMAMGIIAGVLISLFSLIIDSRHHVLSLIVGFSLFMSITISGLMGAAIPFVLNRFNIDPAVAAGPFITNFNDVVSIFIYLGLATSLIVFLV